MRRIIGTVLAVGLTLSVPATVDAAHKRCSQYEHLLVKHAPKKGWSVSKMSGFMYRESRCQPNVRSRTRDTGLLQINDINLAYLSKKFGTTVDRTWLQNPENNVRAAAALCEFWRRAGKSCYRPWAL